MDIEQLLEMVPEELRSCGNWNVNAQLKKRRENRRLQAENPSENSVKGLAEAFADLNRLLKKFENTVIMADSPCVLLLPETVQ